MAEITRIEDALYDIVEAENPMTVRQVFYRAVSAGLVPKTEDAYEKTVQRLLLRMRKREERPLPWRWIAKEVVLHTVEQVRGLVAGFRAIFSGACT